MILQNIINAVTPHTSAQDEIITFYKSIIKTYRHDYSDDNDTMTRTVQDFKKRPYGTCYDVVNYIYFTLNHLNPICFWLCWIDKTTHSVSGTHTIIIFPNNILCEISYTVIKGVYKFNSIDDALAFEFNSADKEYAAMDQKFYYVSKYTPTNKKQQLVDFAYEREYEAEANPKAKYKWKPTNQFGSYQKLA